MIDPQDLPATPSESESLPLGWTSSTVNDLVSDIEAGLNVRCDERPPIDGEKGLVKISAVTWGKFQQDQSKTLPSDAEVDENRKIESGDFLISRANTLELVGACVIVDRVSKNLYLSDKVLRLQFRLNEQKPWVLHFLRSKEGRSQIENLATGNQLSMRNLSQNALRSIEIPLPPLAEQIRIADKLDALLSRVEAGRERIERVPKLIKAFRQSVLSAAVSGELTREWRGGRDAEWEDLELRDCATDFSYGSSAKSDKIGVIPVLRMGNIQKGELDWDDLVFTSDPAEIEKYRLQEGDILFNRTNSPELVGKTAIYRGQREAIYAGYLIRVKTAASLIPDFLNYCLNSQYGRDYCWQVKTDGVSQSNINAQKLRDFPISLPPLPEQQEIVRRVESLFSIADRLEQRYAQALSSFSSLTPALLAKAFRGELVSQDPADEPASVLLERIRAQRAASGNKQGRGAGKAVAGKRGRPRKGEASTPEASSVQDAIA